MKPKTEQSDSSEHSGEHLIGSLIHSAQKMDDGMLITPQLSAMKSKRGCNCQKSRCIKLYCECYANGVYCNDCNCLDCLNNGRNEVNTLMSQHSRKHAIKTTLEKNPSAFQPKISNTSVEVKAVDAQAFPRHSKVFSVDKGCACRKSHCLKKYCECFQAGIPCTDLCKCCVCHNLSVMPQANYKFDDKFVSLLLTRQVKANQKGTPRPANSYVAWRSYKDKVLLSSDCGLDDQEEVVKRREQIQNNLQKE